jgi:hypothetical protein
MPVFTLAMIKPEATSLVGRLRDRNRARGEYLTHFPISQVAKMRYFEDIKDSLVVILNNFSDGEGSRIFS